MELVCSAYCLSCDVSCDLVASLSVQPRPPDVTRSVTDDNMHQTPSISGYLDNQNVPDNARRSSNLHKHTFALACEAHKNLFEIEPKNRLQKIIS